MKRIISEIRDSFIRSDFLEFFSGLNVRRLRNLLNAYIGRKTGRFLFPARPVTLFIEIVNGCNFNCVGCRAGTLFDRSFMSFEAFKKILDYFSDAIFVYPYGVGESFLNKDIYRMLKYSVDKGFVTIPFSNFSTVLSDKLIDTGIKRIFASIDTFDKEKLQAIRSGANIDVIVRNIIKIQQMKMIRGLDYPEICINSTIMKDNIDDIEDIITNGLELGIKSFYFQTVFTADFLNPQVKIPDKSDLEKVKNLRKKYKGKAKIYLISHYDFERGNYFSGFCQFAYSTLFVTSVGETYPCICGATPERRIKLFGNVFVDGIQEVVRRKTQFLEHFRQRPPEWCQGCPIYFRNC
ncbi:MAG: radical SAM protein [Thermoplasmata archaeon]